MLTILVSTISNSEVFLQKLLTFYSKNITIYSIFNDMLMTSLVLNNLAQIVGKYEIQSTLIISNFTGPDKNVRVISSSRQPNCDVIGLTTVRLSVRRNVLGRHMYMAI